MNAITSKGYKKLQEELKNLKMVERPRVIDAIAKAREHGDLKENSEYISAREEQAHIEGRIQELENMLSDINVVDPLKLSGDKVMFSGTVTIVNEETDEEHRYTIVSEMESDVANGYISNVSPIGKALIGKEIGDSVVVTTPAGEKYYEILDVEYE